MTSTGEIWLVDFGNPYPSEPAYARPAVILGPPPFYGETFPHRFVAPLTTKARGLNFHVEIEPDENNGLVAISYAQVEAVRSIATSRLHHRLGTLDAIHLRAIRTVLARLLALDSRSA